MRVGFLTPKRRIMYVSSSPPVQYLVDFLEVDSLVGWGGGGGGGGRGHHLNQPMHHCG